MLKGDHHASLLENSLFFSLHRPPEWLVFWIAERDLQIKWQFCEYWKKKQYVTKEVFVASIFLLVTSVTYQASHRMFNSYRSQQGVTSTSCYVFQIIDLDPNEDIELSVWMYKLLEDRYWHSWNLLRRGKNPLKRLLTIPKSIVSLVDWTFSVRQTEFKERLA